MNASAIDRGRDRTRRVPCVQDALVSLLGFGRSPQGGGAKDDLSAMPVPAVTDPLDRAVGSAGVLV